MGKTQLTTTACKGDAAPVLSELKSSLQYSNGRDAPQEGKGKHPELRLYLQPACFSDVVTAHICSTVHGDK